MEIFDEYLSITAKIKELEKQLDVIKPSVINLLLENGRSYHNGYNFTMQEKKSWQYSFEVSMLETKLKVQKIQEENDGTAKVIKFSRYPVARKEKAEPISVDSALSKNEVLPF